MKFKLILIFFIFFSNISISQELKFKKIVSLDNPWGSTFINKDEILLTEVGGKIKLVDINSKEINVINHNLNFKEYGQGGLLDIIYQNNDVWISYT